MRGLALVLALSGCGRAAAGLVELTGTLPSNADAVTITVVQTTVKGSRSFALDGGTKLTFGLNSEGDTTGTVLVIAQATALELVVASGWSEVDLGKMGSVELKPLCASPPVHLPAHELPQPQLELRRAS